MRTATPESTPFFGGLPDRGIWTALALTRAQFFLILALSLGLFLFVDGPLWQHVHASHFVRILVSYGVIPFAVTAALARNRQARPWLVIGASAVLAVIKLVLTAGLLVAIALARG